MIAEIKPLRFGGTEGVKVIGSDTPTDLWLECAVTAPPSMTGRTVYLHVPAEQVVDLLKAARDTAAYARSEPMTPVIHVLAAHNSSDSKED